LSKKSEEPEFTKEQGSLKENYKHFSKNALSNLYDNDRIPSTNEILDLTNFLRNNRDMIEGPLYDTCRDYYKEGCNSTHVEFLINLIVSGVFGASVGLLFSRFIFIPFIEIYTLITVIVSLGFGIGYSFYKKYHKQI